jgi:S-adenosyl methyltransferase
MAGKWFRSITPRRAKSPELNTSVAHPARVYDYWLGGKDNFAADREAAEAVIAVRPGILRDIRENRKFLIRAVRYLAAEAGIRQFLDLGSGIPTSPNVHEAAQQAAPACRVVYVDNDPIVLAHARALLTSSDEGATAYLDADLRDPEPILRTAARTLDFGQPVGVILVGVLHLISDDEKPEAIITRLMAEVPSGGYLVATQPASDVDAAAVAAGAQRYNSRVSTPQTRRSRDEVARFFDGLDLVEPGLVQPHRWRPDPDSPPPAGETANWAGVARKP